MALNFYVACCQGYGEAAKKTLKSCIAACAEDHHLPAFESTALWQINQRRAAGTKPGCWQELGEEMSKQCCQT